MALETPPILEPEITYLNPDDVKCPACQAKPDKKCGYKYCQCGVNYSITEINDGSVTRWIVQKRPHEKFEIREKDKPLNRTYYKKDKYGLDDKKNPLYTPEPGDLVFETRFHKPEANFNGDYMPMDQIVRACPSLIGKSVHVDHKENTNPELTIGMILDARFEPWDENCGILTAVISAKEKPTIAKTILDGKLLEVSMTWDCFSFCSICGENIKSVNHFKCPNHKWGETYSDEYGNDTIAAAVNADLIYDEVSLILCGPDGTQKQASHSAAMRRVELITDTLEDASQPVISLEKEREEVMY